MSIRLVLGARISAARRALSITQTDLAATVGVTANQVSRWERGQSMPDARHLRSLAEALRLERDELYILAIEAGAEDYSAVRRERDAMVEHLKELLPLVREMVERDRRREEAVNH